MSSVLTSFRCCFIYPLCSQPLSLRSSADLVPFLMNTVLEAMNRLIAFTKAGQEASSGRGGESQVAEDRHLATLKHGTMGRLPSS